MYGNGFSNLLGPVLLIILAAAGFDWAAGLFRRRRAGERE